MSRIRVRRPSAALVVASIALIVAMTGTAYAGLSIPKNSVGSTQLKNGAVTTAKIKAGAVTAKQVNLKKLGTVNAAKYAATAGTATNATVAATAASAQPTAFALVAANGALDTARTKNVGAASEVSPGTYCISGIPFTPAGGQATVAYANTTNQTAQLGVSPTAVANAGCPAGSQVVVFTQNPANSTASAAGFYAVFYG